MVMVRDVPSVFSTQVASDCRADETSCWGDDPVGTRRPSSRLLQKTKLGMAGLKNIALYIILLKYIVGLNWDNRSVWSQDTVSWKLLNAGM